jgi:phospholipid N-methyltransferase
MKIADNVIAVLKRSTIAADRIVLPPEQLDRNDYVAVNKVIEILGGKWNRKEKAHVFSNDPRPKLSEALGTGDVVDPKKEFQFFETPVHLAEKMALKVRIKAGHTVLEPSAGKGRIADILLKYAKDVWVCEIQQDLQPDLKARFQWLGGDFLQFNSDITTKRFDRIVMNPPFSGGQDIQHIQNAYSLLAPGGKLVALSSPGWTFNNAKKFKEFRAWVEENGYYEDVPEGTFKESGTDIRTLLLEIEKST